MMRTALLLSSLFVAACTVGDIPNGGTPKTDGGASGGDGAAGTACTDRLAGPDTQKPHNAGGGTNAGMGCVVTGCHLASSPGTGAPGYQFAGTIYKPGGTAPNPGVLVRVKSDAGGTPVETYTNDAGNFYISAGSLPNPFPATVEVTVCPTLTPMVSKLSQGGGNCTSSGCHGGTTPAVTIAP